MSEPKRWLEQGAPRDVEHLVRAAQAEQPSEISLGRTLTSLGVGLATTGVAPSAGAAGTAASAGAAATVAGAGTSAKVTVALTGGMIVKWAALGAVLGTLAMGAASIGKDALRVAAQAPAPSVAASARPRTGSLPRAATYSKPEPLEPSSPAGVADVAKTPPVARVAAVATPASSLPLDAETLADEVRSVDRARAALASGHAAQTLAVLDDYERRFPRRGFAPEALYLRMEALLALGRTAQARAAAESLLASYPNSLHRVRARAVLLNNP